MSKLTDKIQRAKSYVDRCLDPAAIYLAGNCGYFLAANEASETMQNAPEGAKTAALLTAGVLAIPFNKKVLGSLTSRLKQINRERIGFQKPASRLSWLKTAALTAATYLAIAGTYNALQPKPTQELTTITETQPDLETKVQETTETEETQTRPIQVQLDPRKIDYSNPLLQKQIEQGVFEKEFLENLEDVCENLNINCMGLLSVMHYETNGTFSPSIKNKASGATGLLQFMKKTAAYLGTSTKKLERMSQVEQLAYVKKYFAKSRRKKTNYLDPNDIALTVFFPAAVGKDPNYVIGDKKGNKWRRRIYKQNIGLDTDNDGKITKNEYAKQALERGYLDRSHLISNASRSRR